MPKLTMSRMDMYVRTLSVAIANLFSHQISSLKTFRIEYYSDFLAEKRHLVIFAN